MDGPWKVIAAFVTVFIAGAVFGGVFTMGVSARRMANREAAPQGERPLTQLPPADQARPKVAGPQAPGRPPVNVRPNAIQPQLMKQFTQKLNLTHEQKKTISPIVARASEDFQRLRQENLADTARVTERMYADVSAVLTMEQRVELEQMRKQMQERVQNERQKAKAAAAAAAANAAVEGANQPAPTPVPAR
jgi:hypothetical protein